jgi:hypothetical protein
MMNSNNKVAIVTGAGSGHVAITPCGFILDTQGRTPYSPTPKKAVLSFPYHFTSPL